ncbi:MAG: hypothetical protein AAGC67_21335, partial [Myxococcota bacterium]
RPKGWKQLLSADSIMNVAALMLLFSVVLAPSASSGARYSIATALLLGVAALSFVEGVFGGTARHED